MATADQVFVLISSHVAGDNPRFLAYARAIAANERGAGHVRQADRIDGVLRQATTEMVHLGASYADLLTASTPTTTLANIHEEHVRDGLRGLIEEQRRRSDLIEAGLTPAWRALLIGPPGTGKTYSAAAIAGELGLPLVKVRPDGILRSHMGESAGRIGKVFKAMREVRGVYLLDEFDGVAPQRHGGEAASQERAHMVNALLQFMEEDVGGSILVCATNHPRILDHALARRFDAVVTYRLPTAEEAAVLLRSQPLPWNDAALPTVARESVGLSHAEIIDACTSARKATVLRPGLDAVSHLRRVLADRQAASAMLAKAPA